MWRDMPQVCLVLCEEELLVPRPHCFVVPRKGWKEGAMTLRTSAPVFCVLKEDHLGA